MHGAIEGMRRGDRHGGARCKRPRQGCGGVRGGQIVVVGSDWENKPVAKVKIVKLFKCKFSSADEEHNIKRTKQRRHKLIVI